MCTGLIGPFFEIQFEKGFFQLSMESDKEGNLLNNIIEVEAGVIVHGHFLVDLLEHEHGIIEFMLFEEFVQRQGNTPTYFPLSNNKSTLTSVMICDFSPMK